MSQSPGHSVKQKPGVAGLEQKIRALETDLKVELLLSCPNRFACDDLLEKLHPLYRERRLLHELELA